VRWGATVLGVPFTGRDDERKVRREAVTGVGVLSMPTIFEDEKERKGCRLGTVSVGELKKVVRRFISLDTRVREGSRW
jgi:hypothetical protein